MILTGKIHLLRIDFDINISPGKKIARFVNIVLILGDKITLIDTGVKDSEEKISGYLRQFNRDLSEIGTVILSHAHPDHIGSAAAIKALTGCRILAHEAEKEWIENIEIQNKQRPVPGFFNLVDTPVKVDELLSDNREITADRGLTLKILHSPGHSGGSLNVFFKEDQILFTADSIPLKGDIPNYDNYPDLIKTLGKIKSNNDYRTLLTSWTAPLTTTEEISGLIAEGEDYLKKIDSVVKESYLKDQPGTLDNCKKAVEKLGLPSFLVNPMVDKAFRSHLFQ